MIINGSVFNSIDDIVNSNDKFTEDLHSELLKGSAPPTKQDVSDFLNNYDRVDEEEYFNRLNINEKESERQTMGKFVKLFNNVEDEKKLKRDTNLVDTSPITGNVKGLSHDENEITREIMGEDMVTIRYVLYVALHEVYNFTSGLLLKYVYKISRV